MNFLEKTIAAINPRVGLIRTQYRQAIDVLEKQRQYDAASHGRRTKGWKSSGASANTEIEYSLAWLRNRSREMVRNNPYARKAKRVVANNTVGSGIIPAPKKKGNRIDAKVKELLAEWAETTQCDFDGVNTFYGIQKLIIGAVFESGEVLVRKRRYKTRSGIPLQLQVTEADFLDHTKTGTTVDGKGNFVIQGIEFDANGKRVAYWLFDQHPGDQYVRSFNMVSKRIPAEDVLHIYYVDRPGQIRGVPFTAASMLKLRDSENYEETQLVRQTIAACFAVFITDFNGSVDNISGVTRNKNKLGEDTLEERIEPGMITRTPTGKDVKFATPPPVEGYGDYMRKIQQGVAAGMGITYEAMTGDLKGVNFSSGRMGWLEQARDIEDLQQVMMIPRFCQPAWEWFIDAAMLAGKLTSNVNADWTTPRREMLDPVKETAAKKEAIRSGLKSWKETVREDGYNPEDVMKEIAEGNEMADKLGVKLDSDGRNKTNGPNLEVVEKDELNVE